MAFIKSEIRIFVFGFKGGKGRKLVREIGICFEREFETTITPKEVGSKCNKISPKYQEEVVSASFTSRARVRGKGLPGGCRDHGVHTPY